MTTTSKTQAKVKKTGMIVFIHNGATPNMPYNKGKLVVSKQPDSAIFCIDKSELEIQ